jgi:hypothetical protein
VRDLLDLTPETIAESQKSAELDLAAGHKRRRRSCARAARMPTKARRALIPESRDWWDEHVAEEEHPATAEGLAEFIRDSLEPICYRMARKPNLPRPSRRKPWAKGCGRTCWRS